MIWLKLGGIIAIITAAVIYHEYDRSRAYTEGEATERLKWQEQRDKDLAAAEAERRTKQAQMDAIKAASDKQVSDLKAKNTQLISEAEQKASEDEKAAPANPACRSNAAVSKRVRDSLQNISSKTSLGRH